ncbi:MAG TPA: hypothetical protein VMZ28_27960, partial [Kofleriaceae bacterium]|nr:hypothetical protein [Kofleriaceae bacterium]
MSKAPAPAAPRKRQLRIASGCATRDSFITVFRRFCDRSSIFIATKTPKPIGEELAFTITLADGAPLITGTGRVVASYADEKGTYGRPGMKIQFGELDSASSRLVDELVATGRAKPATLPPPRPPTPSRSIPAVPPVKPLPSVVAAARSKPPTPPVVPGPVPSPSGVEPKLTSTLMLTPVKRREEDVVVVAPPLPAVADKPAGGTGWDDASEFGGPTRVRGGKSVLPANPLGALEADSIDAFVECTLYEDTGGFGEGEPTSPNFPDDPVGDIRRAGTTLPPFYAGPIPTEMDIVDSMKVPAKLLRAALDTPPQQPALDDAPPATAARAASAAERAAFAAEPIDRTEDILL